MEKIDVRGRGACGHYDLWTDGKGALWYRCVGWDGTKGAPGTLDPEADIGYLTYHTRQPRAEVERVVRAALSGKPESDERIGNDPVLLYAAERGMLQAL